MVKFVPVTDVERPKAAQNLQGAANDKHRKFDNPHTVGTTVDRGWQQGNVGWGVLGAFGNSDKDDAAQVMKHAEGVNKMVKNEKGLWVKVKSVSADIPEVSYPCRGRGRGGGTRVFGEPLTLANSSREKMVLNDEIGVKRSNDRPDSRFRDASEVRSQHRDRRDSHRERSSGRSRSRSRSRSKSRGSRRDRGREHSRSRSNDRKSRRSKRDRSRDRSKSRKSRRSDDRSRSRSGSNDKRSRKTAHRKSHSNEDHEQRRPSRRSPSQSRSPSNARHSGKEASKITRRDRNEDPSLSPPSSRRTNDRHRGDYEGSERKDSYPREGRQRKQSQDLSNLSEDGGIETITGPSSSKGSQDAVQVFEFLAIQLANRFLEVFSGNGLSGCGKKELNRLFPDTDDDDNKRKAYVSNIRLDLIGSLFIEQAAVLSMKSGKVMLSGKSAIRGSFARTLPEACRCSFRIVVNIPAGARRVEKKGTQVEESEASVQNVLEEPVEVTSSDSTVSFCLDFHAPNSSPGLGDRTKDACLLYRCENSLLTHIWGAVDADKLSSTASKSDGTTAKDRNTVHVTRDVVLKSKCWVLSGAIIKLDYPSFSELIHDNNVLVYHDYNTIESWG